jgi:hypothetical protein
MDQPSLAEAPPRERRPVPASVRYAVRVMYAGAAASVAGAAGYLLAWYFEDYVPTQSPSFVPGDSGLSISSSPAFAWLIGLGGLVVLCSWLWTAWMCAQGRGWARIVATVLLILQVYTLYGALYKNFVLHRASWVHLIPAVSFVIGLTAVILLWQRASTAFFKAAKSR